MAQLGVGWCWLFKDLICKNNEFCCLWLSEFIGKRENLEAWDRFQYPGFGMRAVNHFGCAFFFHFGECSLSVKHGRKENSSSPSNSHLLHFPSYLWSVFEILEVVFCSNCCYLGKNPWKGEHVTRKYPGMCQLCWIGCGKGRNGNVAALFCLQIPYLGKGGSVQTPLFPLFQSCCAWN